jgi:hypothetical protein
MRKILVALILALVVVALSLSLAFAQSDQAVIDDVFTETESIRGLKADPNIPVNYLTRDELEQRMLEDFTEDNPEEEIQDAQDIMVMLGFIEPDLDLEEFYIALLTEQIAGFYDPEDDSLYLVSESQSMSAMDQYTLSHEFVHYLQDQNFDLMRPPFHDPDDVAVETDDDASFAATCLVEGDAVISSEYWLLKYLDAEDLMDMQLESGDYSSEVLDSAPDYIYDSLLFPYMEGADFARYVHDRSDGFDAIDKAFSEPPTTTEQIYHPEKYLAGEGAIEVKLDDISSELGSGWELDYDNVLGEFDVYELFKPYFMDEDDVETAAAGWAGNRYHYYSNPDGDKLLVQAYAWDSEKDAQEFSSAYVQYIQDRFGDEVSKEAPMGAWMVWSTDDYMLGLKREGENTYLLQATSDEPFQTAVASLGEEGDTIDEGAIKAEEKAASDEETDLSPVIIGVVVGLLVLGIILVIIMFVMYRRPPAPPGQPPTGTYGPYQYPPGGGSGVYTGPQSGGTYGTSPPASPPTVQPPPPPGSQVPPSSVQPPSGGVAPPPGSALPPPPGSTPTPPGEAPPQPLPKPPTISE